MPRPGQVLGFGGHERDREEHGVENIGRQNETQLGSTRTATGLGRNFGPFPWIRIAKLLYQDIGGSIEGHH